MVDPSKPSVVVYAVVHLSKHNPDRHSPTHLGRVALKPLGPRAQHRLHHRHGEGAGVPFQELEEAEDEGLVVALFWGCFRWVLMVVHDGRAFLDPSGHANCSLTWIRGIWSRHSYISLTRCSGSKTRWRRALCVGVSGWAKPLTTWPSTWFIFLGIVLECVCGG